MQRKVETAGRREEEEGNEGKGTTIMKITSLDSILF
jgi:hypothetical protein